MDKIAPKMMEVIEEPRQTQRDHDRPRRHPLPPERCPRCDSMNTKFCYYNNYSLAQPRYFCKTCKRYWTKGGALRNVPFGGSGRRGKKQLQTSSTYEQPPAVSMHQQLALGRSMPIATIMGGTEQLMNQNPMAYDGLCAIGGGFFGVQASQQQPMQAVQPSVLTAAMMGSASSSSGVMGADGHGDVGVGERCPFVLPSLHLEKNLYYVKQM